MLRVTSGASRLVGISSLQIKTIVTEQIRRAIWSRKLLPGQDLVQEVLAQQLGVSRTPVREALQLLADEGFVRRLSNRRMIVEYVGVDSMQENLSVLCAIEVDILQQREKSDPGWCSHVDVTLQRLLSGPSVDAEIRLHEAFTLGFVSTFARRTHSRIVDSFLCYALEILYSQEETELSRLSAFVALPDKNGSLVTPDSLTAYFAGISSGIDKQTQE